MSNESDSAPPRKGLPAVRNQGAPEFRRADTGGLVRSTMTGWLADSQDRALANLAKRTRREADLLKARGELADAYEHTTRRVHRLRHLPQILELDDATFAAEQEAAYRAIDERNRDVQHHEELAGLRRRRELESADADLVESRRRRFTAAQGLENQRRLKRLKLRLWETRTDAERLEAELTLARMRGEKRSGEAKNDDVRVKAEAAFIEAQAEGNDAEADRWQKVLDALDKG